LSDQKKGPKNISDLKAKLGLKKPGAGGPTPPGIAPPNVTPPPGVNRGSDGLVAPPGMAPPGGGIAPPPGFAPPNVTPPPGIAPPPGMASMDQKVSLVAPPGFAPPPRPLSQQPIQDVDIDLDVVGTSKGKKMMVYIIAAAACLLTFCGGFYVGDIRLKRDWVAKSKKSCIKTSQVIKQLHKSTVKFEGVFEEEVEKTKKGRSVLTAYNPNLFRRLSDAIDLLDVTSPKVKGFLNKNVWTTHYRFVKNAAEILPRLHTFLGLLTQLKAVVQLGQAVDGKYGAQLAKLLPGAKPPKQQKKPMFGVLIKGNFGVVFTGPLGNPVKNTGTAEKPTCTDTKVDSAEGYKLSDGNCYWFTTPPKTAKDCAKYSGSLRYFQNSDAELFNRVKCIGMERVFFEAWLYNIVQIKLILAEIKKINPKDLYVKFRKSGQ